MGGPVHLSTNEDPPDNEDPLNNEDPSNNEDPPVQTGRNANSWYVELRTDHAGC